MDKIILYFNSLKMCDFLAYGGIWVNGSREVCGKIILVPYVNVTDIMHSMWDRCCYTTD